MVATAYFAAGCFWGVEDALSKLPGVRDAVSGYQGGHTVDPTYEEVCAGDTGHAETVRVTFDSSKITYRELLKWFFDNFGPSPHESDRKSQYRGAIFAADEAQLAEAQTYAAERYAGRAMSTQIALGGRFLRSGRTPPELLREAPPLAKAQEYAVTGRASMSAALIRSSYDG